LLPFFETSDYLRDLRSFPTRRSSDLKHAVAFVRAFDAAGKPLAAICHAPWLLAESGAAKGRELTSWPSLRTDLENAGARWNDARSEEHTSELQSRENLVCRLLLEKK